MLCWGINSDFLLDEILTSKSILLKISGDRNNTYYLTKEDVECTEGIAFVLLCLCLCFILKFSYNSILTQKKKLFLFFLVYLLVSVIAASHRPSSNPTQMLAPIPEGDLWNPVSTSSVGEGSGTYSRHRTAEPICKLFTALGMGLLRENISICPWEPSPPATCRKKKNLVEKGQDPMLKCTNGSNRNGTGNKLYCWNIFLKSRNSRTRPVSLWPCLQCVFATLIKLWRPEDNASLVKHSLPVSNLDFKKVKINYPFRPCRL